MPYEKEICENCSEVNWVDMGDPEALWKAEPEGVECHACGHKQILSCCPEESLMEWYCVDTPEELDVYFVKGESNEN